MKVSQKEEEKVKRRDIIQEKTNRVNQISEKLRDIEVERQRRRTQRNSNPSIISTPRASSVMSSPPSLRSVSALEDPEIALLRLKIEAKKNARLHKKNTSNTNSTRKPSNINKSSILPISQTGKTNGIKSTQEKLTTQAPTFRVNYSHNIDEVIYYGEGQYVLESLKGNLARMHDEVEVGRRHKHATFAETESELQEEPLAAVAVTVSVSR